MTPDVELSPEQIRRIASIVEAILARERTVGATAKALGIGKMTVVRIRAKPAKLHLVRRTLEKIATAAGPLFTVEQLLCGKVQIAAESPPPRRARGSVVVRRRSQRR